MPQAEAEVSQARARRRRLKEQLRAFQPGRKKTFIRHRGGAEEGQDKDGCIDRAYNGGF